MKTQGTAESTVTRVKEIDLTNPETYKVSDIVCLVCIMTSGRIYYVVGPIDRTEFFYVLVTGPGMYGNIDQAIRQLAQERMGVKNWPECRFVKSLTNLRNDGVIKVGFPITVVGRTGESFNSHSTCVEQIYVIR